MEEEINCRAKLISQHNRWIKRELADCCFPVSKHEVGAEAAVTDNYYIWL